MSPMLIASEEKGRCSCFGFCERKFISDKYDFGFRTSLQQNIEELNDVDLRAILGKQIISKMPTLFKIRNKGRFVAVTFTGKVLAVCATLEALNKEIAGKHIKENYYIERLGYDSITQL